MGIFGGILFSGNVRTIEIRNKSNIPAVQCFLYSSSHSGVIIIEISEKNN